MKFTPASCVVVWLVCAVPAYLAARRYWLYRLGEFHRDDKIVVALLSLMFSAGAFVFFLLVGLRVVLNQWIRRPS